MSSWCLRWRTPRFTVRYCPKRRRSRDASVCFRMQRESPSAVIVRQLLRLTAGHGQLVRSGCTSPTSHTAIAEAGGRSPLPVGEYRNAPPSMRVLVGRCPGSRFRCMYKCPSTGVSSVANDVSTTACRLKQRTNVMCEPDPALAAMMASAATVRAGPGSIVHRSCPFGGHDHRRRDGFG